MLAVLCCNFTACSKPRINNAPTNTDITAENNRNRLICENSDSIFYFNYTTIKKLSKDDNSIHDVFTSDDIIEGLEYFNNRLYCKTDNGKNLISMDTNGENVISNDISAVLGEVKPSSYYVFDNNIYLQTMDASVIYKVNTDTLDIELVNIDIKNKFILSEENIFVLKKGDDNKKQIYKQDESGDLVLFSKENGGGVGFVNFTDDYVFYTVNNDDFTSAKLFRVKLDGSNIEVIKEINPRYEKLSILYDANYIYLMDNDKEYWKINKNTLEKSNIISMIDLNDLSYEIANEMLFYTFTDLYYINTCTGEKADL
ncbi:MAG: hypothetical protein RR198_04425 [Oscillospiraceae bacterium]